MASSSRKKRIAIILVSIGIVSAAFFLFQKKQQELLDATMEGMKLGELHGRMGKQSSCMSGLKMKYAQCNDIACELSAHGFISACLGTAEADSFCAGLPSPKDSKAALAWADRTCASLELYNTKCEAYIHKTLSVCHAQTTGKPRSTGELIQDGFNRGYEQSR